jgi:hypothetical protein
VPTVAREDLINKQSLAKVGQLQKQVEIKCKLKLIRQFTDLLESISAEEGTRLRD